MPISIINWNVNGIRAVHGKGFGQWFDDFNADIIFLQEIKAKPEQFPKDLLEKDGYEVHINSAERPGYSGTCAWTRLKPKKVEYGFGIEKFDCEGRVIGLRFDDFEVYTIYFPNGGNETEDGSSFIRLDYKMEFYDEFLKYMLKRKKVCKDIIFCGDVNTAHKPIDLARPKQNEKVTGFLPCEREWLDKVVDAGFVDVFREFDPQPERYTWWDYKTKARSRNVGWRIDYFFATKNAMSRITNCTHLTDIMGSDHCPLKLEME